MSKRKKNIAIFTPIICVLAIIMVAVIVLSVMFSDTISRYMTGTTGSGASDETLEEGENLVQQIAEEGCVLLKNGPEDNPALPLSSDVTCVNVFGWAAYDWMTSSFGSGYSNTSMKKWKLFEALEDVGISYNTELYDMYKNFYSDPVTKWGMTYDEYRGDIEVSGDEKFILHEPGEAYYTDEVISNAKAFSDVAIVVIGRTGGESKDLRGVQTKQVQANGSKSTTVDDTRTYLQLSTEEKEMIAAAKKACDTVIVLLNLGNTMEAGFLDDDGIDAAMLVGLTGTTGIKGVINLLWGRDEDGNEISPSGRTADTYAYDIYTAPSTVNSIYQTSRRYTDSTVSQSDFSTKGYNDAYIDYYEGIYVGYRWYETADAEGFWESSYAETNWGISGYDEAVQYPFGYGLSYTSFEWSVTDATVNDKDYSSSNSTLDFDSTIDVTVKVTNTGKYAGKEVVELYYSAPYSEGGVEKSSIVLGDFAKTSTLAPGESEDVRLSLRASDMSSYDCTGDGCYVLDKGDYTISLKKNAHEPGDISPSSKIDGEIVLSVDDVLQSFVDPDTGSEVENRFDSDGIDGYALDGSDESADIVYLSRADFASTFPEEIVSRTSTSELSEISAAMEPTESQLERTGYSNMEMPATGVKQGYTMDDALTFKGYDDFEWQYLLEQITVSELITLATHGYFQTAEISSIGKPAYQDLDGPLGLNTRVTSNTTCNFIAYPSETLLAQTWNEDLGFAYGESVGKEAADDDSGIRGWYAPGANIHRNPYGGRNNEYYSEDALLSGRFASATVMGAKNQGLYCYMKHFVCNDTETLREGLCTFMTEQTLREIYLKPFEIAVKDGGANAVMTSMNRLGATWVGASYALMTEILRDEWGFEGSAVTDWVDTGSTYMPAYKGLWAGNDMWLNNYETSTMNYASDYASDPAFVAAAQRAAHDVLWTLVDTAQTAGTIEFGSGLTFDYTWVWLVVAIEVVLLIGVGLCVFFLCRNLKKAKDAEDGGESDEDTMTELTEVESDGDLYAEENPVDGRLPNEEKTPKDGEDKS